MAAGVNADIALQIRARLYGTAVGDLRAPAALVDIDKRIQITAGTNALGTGDILASVRRTLAASASENIDLFGSVITNPFGAALTTAEITAIYIEADPGNTNDVVFFGAASNAFNGPLTGTTPKLAVGPGDFQLLTNRKGWTVTNSTGDIILVANGGAGSQVIYNMTIFGRTVAA